MLRQVESPVESPEQLLAALEQEQRQQRSRRERQAGQRTALLAGGLLLIVGGAGAALAYLFSLLAELQAQRGAAAPAPVEAAPAAGK